MVLSLKIVADKNSDLRSEEARSMYPSDWMVETRPENSALYLASRSITPVPKIVFALKVLYEPAEKLTWAKASSLTPSVDKLRLAPKAPDPFVEDPTPRCNCALCVELAKSGRLTQKVPWDSLSLSGIPFMVTFTRVASLPRTRIPV